MYSRKPNTVVGFHGCDESIRDDLLNGRSEMKSSSNNYDWLGPGMYFWDGNYDRALEWARQAHRRGKINKPSVVGCVLDLGFCLDFLDSRYLDLLKPAFDRLDAAAKTAGFEMPRNLPLNRDDDLLIRHLDCAVIAMIHEDREETGEREFDSVRGVFWEGEPPYPTAGFRAKNHIQIAIRNPNCLKGFFLPRKPNSDHIMP